VVEQAMLQIAFVRIVAEHEKVEVVRIFGDVLHQVRLRRGKSSIEVRHRFPLPMSPPALDLMNKDVAAPAMLDGRLGIPNAIFSRSELFRIGSSQAFLKK
jgi:hypothetical protein